MDVTELGIVTDASPVHPSKARSPMDVTELEIVTDVSPVHPIKAALLMDVTELKITNLPSLSGGHPYSPPRGGMAEATTEQARKGVDVRPDSVFVHSVRVRLYSHEELRAREEGGGGGEGKGLKIQSGCTGGKRTRSATHVCKNCCTVYVHGL